MEVAVRDLLVEFGTRYPSTNVVVLNALAEGADRLVARVALNLGMSLVVPLPLAQADYEADFADEQSVREFRSLLEKATVSFVVAPAAQSLDLYPERNARSHAYANCGAYLVRRSIEIIALWDGATEPVRGTTEVVTFQLEGVPAPYISRRSELDIALLGPVRYIQTQRRDRTNNAHPVPRTDMTYPPTLARIAAAGLFERAKADFDRFNRECVRAQRAPGTDRTFRQNVAAVAARYRRRTARVLATISVMVFLSVIGSNAYAGNGDHPFWILIAYLMFVAIGLGAYAISRHGDWQNRYQNSRAFSEILRVAHYWKLAGVDQRVSEVFNENHREEIDWLPFAIQSATEPFGGTEMERPRAELLRDLRRVHQEWILGQYDYFTSFAGRRERRRSIIATRLTTTALIASIILTVIGRLLPAIGRPLPFDQTILLVATLSAVVAALIKTYAERRGWEEQARRYELMAAMFGRAHAKIEALLRAEDPDDHVIARVRDVLRSVGEEAIREGAAWLSLHRSRPLDAPHA